MFFIESERLKLIPLKYTELLLLRESREKMEQAMSFRPSNMVMDQFYIDELNDALDNFWLPNSLLYPYKYEWYTNWEIVNKETNASVGGIGFAGQPNKEGEVVTGYCICQTQQGKGYGTEALCAITNWTFTSPDVIRVSAETPINNYSSMKMLRKAGFEQTWVKDEMAAFTLVR
jgi:ribosomal-protein-alanine N-acetyltransferase